MNLFKKYNPLDDLMFQLMDENGEINNNDFFPSIDEKRILKAYQDMLFARTADLMTISYQRQGRIFTYPPNYGQEAISGGIAAHIKHEDWLVPAFREMGAYLAKGATLKELFLYFMGYEDGSKFENAKNFVPMSVPIASQLSHAVGIGFAVKERKEDNIVYTVVGDGGTSEGDFHEALNFAGVWKTPVIFIVQNNQFAISVPFKIQTASKNIAVKSLAYGIPGIKVDGNDFFAMYTAIEQSIEHIKKGNGPVLIEAVTYRKGAHTTSDDPSKYRTKEEESSWEAKDPLKRLKAWLVKKKLWTDSEEEKIIAEFKNEVDRIFVEAENYGPYKLEDVFKYMYAEMPDDLKQQRVAYEKFLAWKEARS